MNTTMRAFLGAVATTAVLACGPALAQADNTNSKMTPAFSGWMTDYSRTNNGRISRDAYMQEQGRRWDSLDSQKQGLTIEQINGTYGYTSTTAMGTVTAPGYMGPKDVKK